ncbi:S-adenosyl-L-methionine-dependent methyltransferase [Lasiosphaeria ovina]|uniref:S-adenosyl-L-methionine-dependent methyltransferase n=1 Tax=Lasiosphaeria ovina TaxID=92902 RepID=A0AAE0KBV0_9PEZI|nr:S-adenosyl-L-methionine-dependent methyltransferase [Lasiosphaeria ovina]
MSETGAYIHGHSAEVLQAHARRTAARDAAYLIPHLQPSFSILDVGCGPGTISADLAALDAAWQIFSDATFDVVHAHQVVIHLAHLVAALREIRRVLKPGGLLASKDNHGYDHLVPGRPARGPLGARYHRNHRRVGCWSFADDEAVAFWGRSCAARLVSGTELRKRFDAGGYATELEADEFVATSQAWAVEAGAWFGCMNGELLA